MVSIRKNWILLIELPFRLRELTKEGYTEHKLHTGVDPRRVELRSWKPKEKVKPLG